MFVCFAHTHSSDVIALNVHKYGNMFYRYLKNVFPKVDETILLEILEQSDNNVQKASEKLIDLGYEKRNPTLPAKAVAKKRDEEQVMNFTPPLIRCNASYLEMTKEQ